MAETIFVKVAGTWREVDVTAPVNPFVKVAGTWRSVSDVFVKVAGVWERSWPTAPAPLVLNASGITHNTFWAGGAGDTGTCYPNGGCGAGPGCYPRNYVTVLDVYTFGFVGHPFPTNVIKTGSQTVSFSSTAYMDLGFNLWYQVNGAGPWVYAASLGTHWSPGQGWVSAAGSFAINIPAASRVRFATSAGNCWQDYVASGAVTLNFPNA